MSVKHPESKEVMLENWQLKVEVLYYHQTQPLQLTLFVPILDEEKKITFIFIFTLLFGASKGFMKAFIKPFRHHKEVWN